MKDYKKESQRHFDKQAEQYDANTSTYYSGPAKVSCADAEEYLKERKFERLLDVGCGTGWLIRNLSERHSAYFFGLDLSEGMLAKAREKNIRKACFVQGSSDELPYDEESFDVVTCIQSFHHYPDGDAAMKEAYRVLKNGGIYLLSDTGVGGLGAWIDNHILFKLLKSGDCHTTNREGICKMMEQAGFEVIRSERLKGFIYTVVGKKPEHRTDGSRKN